MDVNDAIYRLEQARKNLSVQSSDTKNFWQDNMRYQLYNNVINHYDPDTINFIADFRDRKEKFDAWVNKMRSMDSEN